MGTERLRSHALNKDLVVLVETELRALRDAIDIAINSGFSQQSTTPARFLFEAATDLLQILGENLVVGTSQTKLNQDLKESEFVDALSNPKLVKIGPKFDKPYWDPQAGIFIKFQLPAFLIALKNHKSFDKAFLELNLKPKNWYLQAAEGKLPQTAIQVQYKEEQKVEESTPHLSKKERQWRRNSLSQDVPSGHHDLASHKRYKDFGGNKYGWYRMKSQQQPQKKGE